VTAAATDTGTDVVAYVVAKGKKELARRVVQVEGAAVTPLDEHADAPAPDVTFTLTPELAAALDDGSLDISVGFMRGQIKMAGDSGALLRVLPALRGFRPAVAP
jgi:hypothetical protein